MNTKEKLFEAALYLFSEQGYKATTIREITKRTGLSPGSFYNHFTSKDELLQAVYDYYTGCFISPLEGAGPLPDYEQILRSHGPVYLFEFLTKGYIDAMRNETLARLTKIILMEQYTNPVAGTIACRDRQRLLTDMEDLFLLMHRLGYIRGRNPKASGRMLGYVYLGFSADNMHDFFLAHKDPEEIAARQNEIIRQFLREILITD